MDTILIERWPTLGGVCLNVGCIPSKALLHTAALIEHARALKERGVWFGEPDVDLTAMQQHKEAVIKKLTTGLEGMAKARKVRLLRGVGTFASPRTIEIASGTDVTTVRFEQAIVAAGSEAVALPFAPDDERIVDSTGALELRDIPKKLLVIGGGIIGLEMSKIYSALGSNVDCVEMEDGLMPGADRDLVKIWRAVNEKTFRRIMLRNKVTAITPEKAGVHVSFSNADDPEELYDRVLVAVGRTPNGRKIGAESAGIFVTDKGFIAVDRQQRTNVSHIFAIGDIAGGPMLAHKAVHEGHVAAEAAAGKDSHLDARQIPSVAYTDPEIAWTGLTEDQANARGQRIAKAVFPWAASGRAIASGYEQGLTKLLFDPDTRRCLGGGIVGAHAGDLIGEICLAVEMGADAEDIAKTIHAHPTFAESVGLAAEVAEGSCTDLPNRQSVFRSHQTEAAGQRS